MKIEVIEIKEKADGGSEIIFDIDEEYKDMVKKSTGMKRWNQKKFEKFVIQALQEKLNK